MKDLQELMSLWQQVEIQEKKKLDPVGQEDGDIDNDGDTDSSDEYLKNRRKKVSSSVKSQQESQQDEDCDCDLTDEKEPKKKVSKKEGYGTKKESSAAYGASQQKIADKKKKDAMSSSDKDKLGKLADLMKKEGKMECPKCKGEGCDHCEGKGYHMKEEVESLEDMVLPTDRSVAKWTDFSEKYDELNSKGKKRPQDMPIGQSSIRDVDSNKQTKGATPPEGIMDKESPKSKQFYKDHQKSDPKWENLEDEGHDDVSKAGRGVKSQSPNRMGRDNRSGDTKVINPITQKV